MDSGLETLLGTSSSDGSDSSSPPSEDSKSSSPPPKGDDSKSSDSSTPPPDSSSSTPPPESSPPPPDSSPPPPDSSPPPSKSESPPPKEESPSPPPPKEESPESESPPSPSTPDKSPSPKKSPSPDKSPEKSPGTPPPANSPPPPASGAPPALTVSQSPPLPGQLPNGTRSQPPPADKLSPPSRPGSGSSMAPRPASSPSSSVNAGIIAGVTVVGVGILVAVIICLVCAARKKKRKQYYMDAPPNGKGEYYGTTNWNTQQNPRPPPGLNGAPSNGFSTWTPPQVPPGPFSGEHSSGFSGQFTGQMGGSPNLALNNQSSFSYEELARATNGFADENVIGQGGYGYVHKGVLPSGKEVAVKSLKSGSGQGDREFQAEVEIISRVHHRHLVSLVGYCVADGQRMLVYEFVPNKTLEFHLHGKGQPTMLWSTRMRIALGAAKGLAYLHEDCHPKIIHRDIKAANILIDFNFEAMVADFGLAKLTSDTSTHVSTRVMGTFGYMAPEYASSGKLTDKSDVFSFGVMLLELITGRKPIDPTNQIMEDSLVDWARPLLGRALEDGNYGELVDPLLENKFDPHEMNRMIACAAASVRHSARRRPKMTQIARSLEGDQSSLDDTAIKQGQSPETATYDTTAYNADMMKFKQMVMSSNYASEDFEQTSDYGLQPSTSSSDLGSREFPSSGPQKPKL